LNWNRRTKQKAKLTPMEGHGDSPTDS